MSLPTTDPNVRDKPRQLSRDNLHYFCRMVYDESGIVLDESKEYLLESRLSPLARVEGAPSLDDLCNLVRAMSGPRLRQRVVEAMTTNETLFFRDAKPFEVLEKSILPELMERNRDRRQIRIWSAACSSGQEPYSLAMIWLEMASAGWNLDILATDLSDEILARAQAGRFMQLEVNRGLPAKYLVKYFTRQGLEWQMKSEVSKMIRWRRFNLKDDMTWVGQVDLVLCRNVLIYFDLETKRRILGSFRRVLVPAGYLLLGSSETTLGADESYVRKQVQSTILYQSPGG